MLPIWEHSFIGAAIYSHRRFDKNEPLAEILNYLEIPFFQGRKLKFLHFS